MFTEVQKGKGVGKDVSMANPWRPARLLACLAWIVISGAGGLVSRAAWGDPAKTAPLSVVSVSSPGNPTPITYALAGSDVVLKMSGPVPSDPAPDVKFLNPETPAPISKIDGNSIQVTVPPGIEGSHNLTVSSNGVSQGSAYLTIYPYPNAAVTDIQPRIARPDMTITVMGTGLKGPKDQVKLRLGTVEATTISVAPDGSSFSARFSQDQVLKAGQQEVQVTVLGVAAKASESQPLTLTLLFSPSADTTQSLLYAASLPLLVTMALVWGMYSTAKRPRGQIPRGLTAALIFEPRNSTYSLARVQFLWWMSIIAVGYSFLFLAQGFVRNLWEFPSLAGFTNTFLISLGTLLAGQAVTTYKGAKGANQMEPKLADLISNGGVIALERVQQVLWSLLAGVGYLWIIFKTYQNSSVMPTIPQEMLVLMGLSSAGYLGGKIVGKSGPIISQLWAEQGSIILKIQGVHLSMGTSKPNTGTALGLPSDIGVRILVDDFTVPIDAITTLEGDPDHPTEFAKLLQVVVPDSAINASPGNSANPPATVDSDAVNNWLKAPHTIRIINADGQRAEWQGTIELRSGSASSTSANTSGGNASGSNTSGSNASGGNEAPAKDTQNRISTGVSDLQGATGQTSASGTNPTPVPPAPDSPTEEQPGQAGAGG